MIRALGRELASVGLSVGKELAVPMPSDAARILDRLLDQWWEPDTPYLTDGTKLYRYAGAAVSNTAKQLIGLEDCQSLEILLFDVNELCALRLRPVVGPAAIESGTRHRLRQT